MIKYFTNKMLAEKLKINLAKWKRWSREFLPPDPLGGMQSGYARQYRPDEAFTVYLGGYLVAQLNFSIPDSRQILQDLRPWLSANGYDFNPSNGRSPDKTFLPREYDMIFIAPVKGSASGRFHYLVRRHISTQSTLHNGRTVFEGRFTEEHLPSPASPPALSELYPVKLVVISNVLRQFVRQIDMDETCYAALYNPR